jgi:hypothetical protein
MIHRVMNCKEWDEKKFVPNSFATIKIDGVRAYYYRHKNLIVTRQFKPLFGFHKLKSILHEIPAAILDMELVLPGYTDWNEMAGKIRSYEDCSNAQAWVLDIPSSPKPYVARINYMRKILHNKKHASPYLLFDAPVGVGTVNEVEHLYKQALEQGHEGLVIKTQNHYYRHARSYDWMRMVPYLTLDLPVIDVYEGKGKMAGMAGGIIVEYANKWHKVGTLFGLDYSARRDLLKHKEKYIGRIAEIVAKEKQMKTGNFRQPTFKRWRLDKDETA